MRKTAGLDIGRGNNKDNDIIIFMPSSAYIGMMKAILVTERKLLRTLPKTVVQYISKFVRDWN